NRENHIISSSHVRSNNAENSFWLRLLFGFPAHSFICRRNLLPPEHRGLHSSSAPMLGQPMQNLRARFLWTSPIRLSQNSQCASPPHTLSLIRVAAKAGPEMVTRIQDKALPCFSRPVNVTTITA